MREIVLRTGEFHFGAAPARIRTVLGSCVAITMWHPEFRIGGMCHYLLPAGAPRTTDDARAPGMYAEEAIELFVRAIHQAGTHRHDYVVKLFGGGRMFAVHEAQTACAGGCDRIQRRACTVVSCKNITVGREMLGAYGFCVAAENVGGAGSRNLTLDLDTGHVWLRRGESVAARLSAS